jgi:hypothetical protein
MLTLKSSLIHASSEIRTHDPRVSAGEAIVIGLPLLYFIPASEIDLIGWNNYQPKA